MKEAVLTELVSAVKAAAGEGYEVQGRVVRKNNGVHLNAVTIKKPEDALALIIYIDQYVDKIMGRDMTIEYAVRDIVRTCEGNKCSMVEEDAARLIDKEFVLSHAEYQLVNKARNSERIALAPHKDILDLSALYRVVIYSDEIENAGYVISNEMLSRIGISVEELDKAAARNTEKIGFEVKMMDEILAETMYIPAETGLETGNIPQIFILTNKRRMNGAAVLMYSSVLQELSDRVGDDIFILPSSIHEVLAVPASQTDPDGLAAIVRDVNSSVVSDEEILGYHVYRYARTAGELGIA